MELSQVIEKRRSIRRFKPDPVPDEHLQALLEAARLAPSGSNIQPWRFVVVKDPETRQKLGECTFGLRFVAQAPAVIVCCADLKAVETRPQRYAELWAAGAFAGTDLENLDPAGMARTKVETDEEAARAYVSLNTAIAIEHMVLKAVDLGLGSCWVMMFSPGKVKRLLNLGESIVVVALLPVGYPDQDPPPRPRVPKEDILLGWVG